MNPPSNRVDKHGFPIPSTIDQVMPARDRPRWPAGGLLKWTLGLVFVGLLVAHLWNSPFLSNLGQEFAGDLFERGRKRLLAGDVPGALGYLDWAAALAPQDARICELRAHLLLKSEDPYEAAVEYTRLIELEPRNVEAYLSRCYAYQWLKRPADAIYDATQAVELTRYLDHNALNSRAYARAVGNLELNEALGDIEMALRLYQQEDPNQPPSAAYLDTRGWVFYGLSRYDEALRDLNQAIELTEQEHNELNELFDGNLGNRFAARRIEYEVKRIKQNLAVMYYHRGEVESQMGDKVQGQADLERGRNFGYNPDRGVF